MKVVPNLAWARTEVLNLVRELVAGDDAVGVKAVMRLCELNSAAEDPGRRMALLVQLSAALAGTLTISELRPGGIDRDHLVDDLGHLVKGALHDVPLTEPILN